MFSIQITYTRASIVGRHKHAAAAILGEHMSHALTFYTFKSSVNKLFIFCCSDKHEQKTSRSPTKESATDERVCFEKKKQQLRHWRRRRVESHVIIIA